MARNQDIPAAILVESADDEKKVIIMNLKKDSLQEMQDSSNSKQDKSSGKDSISNESELQGKLKESEF